jgi:GAF domain-containing protein
VGNPSYEQMLATKESVIINDALQDPLLETVREQVHQLGIKSLLLAPILARGEVVGALGADSTETIHEFTTREATLVRAVADQLGIAIENRRLLEEAQTRVRREQLLREITTRVRNAVDAETIMRTAVQEVGRTLGRPAFIYLGSGEQQPDSAADRPVIEVR